MTKIMKKIVCMMVVVAMGVVAMAEQTAHIRVTLKGEATVLTNMDRLSINEVSDKTNDFNDGADVDKVLTNNDGKQNHYYVNLYAMQGTHQCSPVYTNKVSGLYLVVMTNLKDTKYTLSFDQVDGRELSLYDVDKDSVIVCKNGGTYTFEAETNKTIDNRFYFYTPYEICYRGGKLQITGSPATATSVEIKDATDTPIVGSPFRITNHDYQEIDLTTLSKGHYTIVANGDTLTIGVQ